MGTINNNYRQIEIYMYYKDNDKHKIPHIHSYYGDKSAVYDLFGNFIEGDLDRGGRRLTEEWIKGRETKLQEMWKSAVKGVPNSIHKID